MRKNIKSLLVVSLTVLMLALVGCGNDASDNNSMNDGMNNGMNNGANTENGTNSNTPMTKEEYANYVTERYNHYFGNADRYTQYDIYGENFDYGGNFNEFATGYTTFYGEETSNLKAFRNDLEKNVRKGDAEVDKVNSEIITATDKAITASEEYGGSFTERTKDYGTLAKDEVITGLRDIGRAPYDARVELHKLVSNVKTTLGVK